MNPADETKLAHSRWIPWHWIGLAFGAVTLFACSGWRLMLKVTFVEVMIPTVFGWAPFLIRVVPQVRFDAAWTTTFVTFGGLSLLGIHLTGRWLTARANATPFPWRFATSAKLFVGLVALFGTGIAMVGVTHQTAWMFARPEPSFRGGSLRDRAGSLQSMNNLKQLGLGAHWVHDTNHRFPEGCRLDVAGVPMHGWPTFLLPFVEHKAAFDKIDLDRPWSDPVNEQAIQTDISVYRQPLMAVDPGVLPPIYYSGNVYMVGPNGPTIMQDIADGASNTLLYGEIATEIQPWAYPVHWRDPTLGLNTVPHGFGSRNDIRGKAFTQFCLADGSVRRFTNDVSPSVLKALATPSGNEPKEIYKP